MILSACIGLLINEYSEPLIYIWLFPELREEYHLFEKEKLTKLSLEERLKQVEEFYGTLCEAFKKFPTSLEEHIERYMWQYIAILYILTGLIAYILYLGREGTIELFLYICTIYYIL